MFYDSFGKMAAISNQEYFGFRKVRKKVFGKQDDSIGAVTSVIVNKAIGLAGFYIVFGMILTGYGIIDGKQI